MTIALAVMLIGAARAVVAYPLFRARAGVNNAPRDAEEFELRERREAALAALQDVEFDYRVGKLSEEDYHALRAQLKTQAVAALKNYEQVRAPSQAMEIDDAQVRALDEQIENEVRALRAARPHPQPLSHQERGASPVCAKCGRAAHAADVFCARCGARLAEPKRDQVITFTPQASQGLPARRGAISRKWLMGAGMFAAVWVALAGFLYFNAAAQAREQNPIATLRTEDFHALAISPSNPNLIFFGHSKGAMVSRDGGRNWEPLNLAGNASMLAISPAAPARVFAAGPNLFARSDDGGKTWRAVQNDLPRQDLRALAALPNFAEVLYAVVGRALFLSEDAGAHWQPIANGLPSNISALAVLSGNPDIFYVGTQGGGVGRSLDGGATWASANGIVSGALRGQKVNALAFDFATGNLYAGTEEGLSFSPSQVSGWIRRNLNGDVAALAVGDDGLTIIVVNSQGQVFRSNDRGVTWSGK